MGQRAAGKKRRTARSKELFETVVDDDDDELIIGSINATTMETYRPMNFNDDDSNNNGLKKIYKYIYINLI